MAPASGDQVLVSSQAFSDSTVIVNRRQIEEQQPRDTRETLQNETGVAVGGGGNAIAQKVYAREIEDTMLNITLDGVPQGGNVFHHQGRVLIDPMSAEYMAGSEIDWVDDLIGASFQIRNPNAKSACGCGTSFSL